MYHIHNLLDKKQKTEFLQKTRTLDLKIQTQVSPNCLVLINSWKRECKLTPLSLRSTHTSSPNVPIIKDKKVLSFSIIFIFTFSINVSVFFSYTMNIPFWTHWTFWKRNSAIWDCKIALWKCSSSPITPNLFNAVTSNDF